MDDYEVKYFIEAALLAAGRPLTIDQLQNLFAEGVAPEKSQIREAISGLQEDYEKRGLTITEVASGFRTQVKASMADRLQKLWEDRPPRYSRALFETLALIAYRQPITRGEIEEIRGVSVSSNIVRSLLEREWVRVVGHRDVPGRPAMFGTTRLFLDYFGLKKLDDLPALADLSDWESLRVQLNLPAVSEDEYDDAVETAEITELPSLRPEDFADDEEQAVHGAKESGVAADNAGAEDSDADEDAETPWPVSMIPAEKASAADDTAVEADADDTDDADDNDAQAVEREASVSGR